MGNYWIQAIDRIVNLINSFFSKSSTRTRLILVFVVLVLLALYPITIIIMSSSKEQSEAQLTDYQSKIYCDKDNEGKPATIFRFPSENHEERIMIKWETLYFGENYPPKRRCEIVSSKLQKNINNGTLRYIVSGFFPGSSEEYPVLCASPGEPTDEIIRCDKKRILMTLNPDESSQELIKKLVRVSIDGDEAPVLHSADDPLESSPNGKYKGINVNIMLRSLEEISQKEESVGWWEKLLPPLINEPLN